MKKDINKRMKQAFAYWKIFNKALSVFRLKGERFYTVAVYDSKNVIRVSFPDLANCHRWIMENQGLINQALDAVI